MLHWVSTEHRFLCVSQSNNSQRWKPKSWQKRNRIQHSQNSYCSLPTWYLCTTRNTPTLPPKEDSLSSSFYSWSLVSALHNKVAIAMPMSSAKWISSGKPREMAWQSGESIMQYYFSRQSKFVTYKVRTLDLSKGGDECVASGSPSHKINIPWVPWRGSCIG